MIREYETRTGSEIGFKPAGGIRAAKQALDWLILMKEELGDRWLRPSLFRLGASSLLTDIERQLEHFVSWRSAAAHRHPMVCWRPSPSCSKRWSMGRRRKATRRRSSG